MARSGQVRMICRCRSPSTLKSFERSGPRTPLCRWPRADREKKQRTCIERRALTGGHRIQKQIIRILKEHVPQTRGQRHEESACPGCGHEALVLALTGEDDGRVASTFSTRLKPTPLGCGPRRVPSPESPRLYCTAALQVITTFTIVHSAGSHAALGRLTAQKYCTPGI